MNKSRLPHSYSYLVAAIHRNISYIIGAYNIKYIFREIYRKSDMSKNFNIGVEANCGCVTLIVSTYISQKKKILYIITIVII